MSYGAGETADWQRFEALSSTLGIVPIPHGDERASLHELSRFIRVALRAVVAQDQDFSIRGCFANRLRTSIDVIRWQIGRAKGFCQPIHQERLRFGQHASQSIEGGQRHLTARTGEVTQMLSNLRWPVYSGEL